VYFSITKPTQSKIDAVIHQCQDLPYTYHDIGCTNMMPSTTALSTVYAMDHNRVQLGVGQATFLQAKQAITQWRMCNLGWAEICGTSKPIKAGTVIACVPQMFGLWLINPCRVVYNTEESNMDEDAGGVTRFGLAYGTLPGHAAAGEERFMVEWHHADNSVWYDILAFSRPGHQLARWGYPIMRQFQKRYGRDSAQAMISACKRPRHSAWHYADAPA